MMNATDQLKVWATPVLLIAVLGLSGFIWTELQGRIKALEQSSIGNDAALAVISANQQNSLTDRTDFQNATTARLDKMADVLSTVGQSLAALTALQQQAQRSSVNHLPEVLRD